MANLNQFNIELLKLQQKYQSEQQLFNTSKHLLSRALNESIDNQSYREALSALIAKSIREVK